jgi:Predicted membrane protein
MVQSEEYKALMARLRREQEEREYQQMINPQPRLESFSQRFPNAPALQQSFAAVNKPTRADDVGDDDVTFNDVHRQLMLILNFIVSIFGVAASLWILARWWSTPARLFLTLGGSILVGIAEVALYLGYIWHLGQEKKKEAKEKEVKEVVQTWTVGPHDADKLVEVSSSTKEPTETSALRRRKSKVNE